MTSVFGILLTALIYFLSGYPFTSLLGRALVVEKIGAGFLIGNGLTTLVWFMMSRLGLPLDLLSLTISALIVYLGGWSLTRIFQLSAKFCSAPKIKGINLWLTIAVLTLLVLSFVIGNYNPISGWDAITLYDFRARTIAVNHSLKDLTNNSYYSSYPLMTSLDHAAVYLLGGINAQGFHALLLIAFTAIVFGRMYQWSSLRLALIASLCIIINEEIFGHATVAYINLAYVVYFITGLLYAVSPRRGRASPGILLFSGIIFGLSTWVRSDVPFWLIGIILLLIQGIVTNTKLVAFLSVLVTYLMRHVWMGYYYGILTMLKERNDNLQNPFSVNTLKQVSGDLPDSATIESIGHNLPEIMAYLYKYIFVPYRGLWILVFPMALVALRSRDSRLRLLIFSIILSGAIAIFGVMLFSTSFSAWNSIGESARRMMIFVVPLIIVTAIYSLNNIKHDKHDEH